MMAVARMLLLCGVLLVCGFGQAPVEDVRQTYAKLCSGCHGADARGSQQGPGLSGNLRLRKRSAQSLRNVIVRGVPAAGMPGFDLPAATLDGLVGLVVSLNASASEMKVPGDVAAGSEFFFGKGQCLNCHMISGRGEAVGPDLSSVATELTVDQLRDALVNPGVRIVPGYELVRLDLKKGGSLRGFARNRTAFEISVQDLKGGLHPVLLENVREVTDEKGSLMPVVQASETELQNTVAFLSRQNGVKAGMVAEKAGGIGFDRILNPKPGDCDIPTRKSPTTGIALNPSTTSVGSNPSMRPPSLE